MIKVGITGNIGSGKTTVCKLFEVLHVPVYYADDEAKKLVNEDVYLKQEIKNLLGNSVYDSNDKMLKKIVAELVFTNKKLLMEYNNIVHPAVKEHSEKWMKKFSHHHYVIKEAALLFESGAADLLDKIIFVHAPHQLKIERVMARDGVSREDVLARLQNQWEDSKKETLSDFIIYNDGKQMLIPQVIQIHKKLMALND